MDLGPKGGEGGEPAAEDAIGSDWHVGKGVNAVGFLKVSDWWPILDLLHEEYLQFISMWMFQL